MDTWRAVAIVGIWAGVGFSAIAGDIVGLVAFFAALATAAIAA